MPRNNSLLYTAPDLLPRLSSDCYATSRSARGQLLEHEVAGYPPPNLKTGLYRVVKARSRVSAVIVRAALFSVMIPVVPSPVERRLLNKRE